MLYTCISDILKNKCLKILEIFILIHRTVFNLKVSKVFIEYLVLFTCFKTVLNEYQKKATSLRDNRKQSWQYGDYTNTDI